MRARRRTCRGALDLGAQPRPDRGTGGGRGPVRAATPADRAPRSRGGRRRARAGGRRWRGGVGGQLGSRPVTERDRHRAGARRGRAARRGCAARRRGPARSRRTGRPEGRAARRAHRPRRQRRREAGARPARRGHGRQPDVAVGEEHGRLHPHLRPRRRDRRQRHQGGRVHGEDRRHGRGPRGRLVHGHPGHGARGPRQGSRWASGRWLLAPARPRPRHDGAGGQTPEGTTPGLVPPSTGTPGGTPPATSGGAAPSSSGTA